MSDPAKTPEEIEDVLASVRRLVSDHASGLDGAASARSTDVAPSPSPLSNPEPAVSQAQPDALVLTPSFRVTDPEDPWVPVAASDDETNDTSVESVVPDEAADEDAPSTQAQAAEDLIAEIVTASPDPANDTSGDGTNWQPDDRLASYDAVGGAEDTADKSDDWTDAHSTDGEGDVASEDDVADLMRLDGPRLPVTEFESETGDDSWPEGGTETALLTLVARRDPAPEVAADSDDAVDLDMDLEDDDAEAELHCDAEPEPPLTDEPEAADNIAEDDEEPGGLSSDDTFEDETAEEGATQDDIEQDNAGQDNSTLAETEQEHNAAPQEHAAPDDLAAQDDVPEHEDQSDPPIADDVDPQPELADDLTDASPMFARSKPRTENASTAPVEDLGDTPSPFTFPETDEGILDEDTLREIIVDVVREELQGVLGQRITRNVRKMVRREIRLAMAVEDLE